MARFAEQSAHGDALVWWRKAFEILDRMKREGRFLSCDDNKFHQQLRRKLQS
jgi:hypothetical protein